MCLCNWPDGLRKFVIVLKCGHYPLHIPELRFLNTFYHTMYGQILSVRCILPFMLRSSYSKILIKNNEDFSMQFARQTKWGGFIDGERHIEKFNGIFYHCFCSGSLRQKVRSHRYGSICLQYCICSHLRNRRLSFISEGFNSL